MAIKKFQIQRPDEQLVEVDLGAESGNIIFEDNKTLNDKAEIWNAKYKLPEGGIPKQDLKQEIQESLNKADSAVQSVKIGEIEYKVGTEVILPESFPASDVYDWAKEENKPSYTAEEVGALPADTVLPKEITESDVTEWGFTKNQGTVTAVKINGETKNPNEEGLVDLGAVEGGGGNTNTWTGTKEEYEEAKDGIPNGTIINLTDDYEDLDDIKVKESLQEQIDSLATVAKTNSYNDLDDKPNIPNPQVNSDWDATEGVSQILNKPNLSTVAISNSYNDLNDKPSIPAAQVNSDWNATSGVAQILNKPSIPSIINNLTSDSTTAGLSAAQGKALLAAMDNINNNLLGNYAIGDKKQFSYLTSSQKPVFFTNWADGTNFPGVYGSGLLIPALDARMAFMLYFLASSVYLRVKTNSTWGDWKIISGKTTSALTISGTQVDTNKVYKSGDTVCVTLSIRNNGGIIKSGWTKIATVPSGSRPSATIYGTVLITDINGVFKGALGAYITTDGELYVYSNWTGNDAWWVQCSFTYLI